MSWALYTALTLVQAAVLIRVLLRPHREPTSRIAWVAAIAALPIVGILAYLLFGEVNIGWRRVERKRRVQQQMPPLAACAAGDEANFKAEIPPPYEHLFQMGHSISKAPAFGGNTATLLPDSNATIDAMVEDIDAAEQTVHLLFYIWLPDNNCCKIVEALKRAAARGGDNEGGDHDRCRRKSARSQADWHCVCGRDSNLQSSRNSLIPGHIQGTSGARLSIEGMRR